MAWPWIAWNHNLTSCSASSLTLSMSRAKLRSSREKFVSTTSFSERLRFAFLVAVSEPRLMFPDSLTCEFFVPLLLFSPSRNVIIGTQSFSRTPTWRMPCRQRSSQSSSSSLGEYLECKGIAQALLLRPSRVSLLNVYRSLRIRQSFHFTSPSKYHSALLAYRNAAKYRISGIIGIKGFQISHIFGHAGFHHCHHISQVLHRMLGACKLLLPIREEERICTRLTVNLKRFRMYPDCTNVTTQYTITNNAWSHPATSNDRLCGLSSFFS